MTEAAPTPAGLVFKVKAKSKARFSIAVAQPAIVLNADWQEWDDSNGHIKGFVRSDRQMELVKVSTSGFHLTRANVPILAVKENWELQHCGLRRPSPEPPLIGFRSDQQLRRAQLWRGQDLKIKEHRPNV